MTIRSLLLSIGMIFALALLTGCKAEAEKQAGETPQKSSEGEQSSEAEAPASTKENGRATEPSMKADVRVGTDGRWRSVEALGKRARHISMDVHGQQVVFYLGTCNDLYAEFSWLGDGTVTLRSMDFPASPCTYEDGQIEQAWLERLQGVSGYEVEQGKLTLVLEDESLAFEPAGINGWWESREGMGPAKGKLTLQIDGESISGSTGGCNGFDGEVSVDGEGFEVKRLGFTEMACEKALMSQDVFWQSKLEAVVRFELGEGELQLFTAEDTIVLDLLGSTPIPSEPGELNGRWVGELSLSPAKATLLLQIDQTQLSGTGGGCHGFRAELEYNYKTRSMQVPTFTLVENSNDLPCTEAGLAQDEYLASLFKGAYSYHFAEEHLILQSGEVQVELMKVDGMAKGNAAVRAPSRAVVGAWKSVAAEGPKQQHLELSFEEGLVRAWAGGCRPFEGPYEAKADDESLRIGPLSFSERDCEDSLDVDQDEYWKAKLESTTGYEHAADGFALLTGQGRVVLQAATRFAQPTKVELVSPEGRWKSKRAAGPAAGYLEMTIEGNQLSGSTGGCNDFKADIEFSIENGEFKVGNLGFSLTACDEQLMAQDSYWEAELRKVTGFATEQGRLLLLQNHKPIVFEKRVSE